MPQSKKQIALERIDTLFKLAEEEAKKGNIEREQRYVKLARTISMKVQEPIPGVLKRKFCKNCDSILLPGQNCDIRLNNKTKTMDIKCFRCNNIKRYPYKNGRNKQKPGKTLGNTKE